MPINRISDVQVIKSGVQLRQSNNSTVLIANLPFYIIKIYICHSTAIKKQVPATFSILRSPDDSGIVVIKFCTVDPGAECDF